MRLDWRWSTGLRLAGTLDLGTGDAFFPDKAPRVRVGLRSKIAKPGSWPEAPCHDLGAGHARIGAVIGSARTSRSR